jgi:hypothetical protein
MTSSLVETVGLPIACAEAMEEGPTVSVLEIAGEPKASALAMPVGFKVGVLVRTSTVGEP